MKWSQSLKLKTLYIAVLAVSLVTLALAAYYWFSNLVHSKGGIASVDCRVPSDMLQNTAGITQERENPNANLFISCGGFIE